MLNTVYIKSKMTESKCFCVRKTRARVAWKWNCQFFAGFSKTLFFLLWPKNLTKNTPSDSLSSFSVLIIVVVRLVWVFVRLFFRFIVIVWLFISAFLLRGLWRGWFSSLSSLLLFGVTASAVAFLLHITFLSHEIFSLAHLQFASIHLFLPLVVLAGQFLQRRFTTLSFVPVIATSWLLATWLQND